MDELIIDKVYIEPEDENSENLIKSGSDLNEEKEYSENLIESGSDPEEKQENVYTIQKEDIERIIENEEHIIRLLERSSYPNVRDSNADKYVLDNKTKSLNEVVSENNIFNTPISEYSITDSLLLTGVVLGFIVVVVIMIRRAIGKWK